MLGQNLPDHLNRFHAGEASFEPLEGVRQAVVIDSQQMKNGGIELVHMYRVLDDIVAVVVSLTEGEALLHAGTCHEHAETAGVMVATIICFALTAL